MKLFQLVKRKPFLLGLLSLLCVSSVLCFYYLKTHPRGFDMDRDEDGEKEVHPRVLQEWFNRGRKSPDGRPSAAHRMEAKRRASALPLARPGNQALQSRLRPGFGIPRDNPPCDWTEMGPSPENDSVDFLTSYVYGNVSGRITSLALDLANDNTGNTLYVGSAYGGVWKTTNGLNGSPTFTPISDPTQSLAMGSLALDTSVNPPIIYVGSGELNMAGDSYYGTGILKTTNDGASWTLAGSANGGTLSFMGLAFSKLLVDPSSPSTVLAAAGFACCHPGITNLNQGLYRSTDQGNTWTQVSAVNGTGQAIAGHSFTDIIYDGSATFYAAVRFQGVYASTDHGNSWTQLPSPFPSGTAPTSGGGSNFARATLAFRGGTLWCLATDANEGPSIPVNGTDTGLSQSADGGHTWTAVNLPANIFGSGSDVQGNYDQYVAAPPSSTALLVAGIDLYEASTVNGKNTSWTNQTNAYSSTPKSHPDQHAVAFMNASTWYIGNDGGVWATQNSGSQFTNKNTNLGTIQFYSVSPDPSGFGKFIGGSQDNGTAANHGNAGSTWTLYYGGDGGYTDANPAMLGQFYSENFGIGLFRSDNYGADFFTHVVVDSNYGAISGDDAGILVPYQVLPSNPATVVLGTSRVWEGPGKPSGDGSGWGPISPYLIGNGAFQYILALAVAPSNTSYIYATTSDDNAGSYQVFTNSGGSNWTNVSTGLPSGNPIAGIAVDPGNPAIAYAGIQGFVGSTGSGHIFQTTNGGGSWTDITGTLPDAPVNWLLVDPLFPGDLYAATDVGVFSTQAVNGASTSWSRMGSALPDSVILQIKMSVTCPRQIVATTHGRGAWAICPLDTSCPPSPTPTYTPVYVPSTSFNVQALPNKTDGQIPVSFAVNLPSSMDIQLKVYDLVGELVFSKTVHGTTGSNSILWPPKNQGGTPLASGLYIYFVEGGGSSNFRKSGKIAVVR